MACSDGGTETPVTDAGGEASDETAVDSGRDTAIGDTGTVDDTGTIDDTGTSEDADDSGEPDADDSGTDAADAEETGDAADSGDAAEDATDAADGSESGTTCTVAADCPGTDTECAQRACTGGVCSITFTAAGTALTAQTAGDCKTAQCDGAGGVTQIANGGDVPVDGNECTDDVCTGTVASNPPRASGAACGTGGSRVCNGAGACVECLTASTCPGTDGECQARTCNSNVCGISFTADGTAVAAQVAGDCKKVVCNGSGGTRTANDDSDVADDSNACTTDGCSSGTATHAPVASGTDCGGGRKCNATGACVECIAATDCPGSDTECATRTCSAGVCGFSFAPAGTVLTTQTAGDCKEQQCNGSGAVTAVNADVDVPVDGNACTSDVCSAGVPSNPPSAEGTSCTGGGVCNASGACVQCNTKNDCPGADTECTVRTCASNLCGIADVAAGTVCASGAGACTGTGDCAPFTVWISHSGDGSAALSPAATPAFIDKLDINVTTSAVTLTRDFLAFPTETSGGNRRLTVSGTASTEGALALSGDGHYVTMAGYDAAVGTASVNGTTASAVNRVISRINATLTIDTTTASTAWASSTNPRSVVTNDGTGFWAGGGTGGIRYIPFGGGTETVVATAPGSPRWVNIFGGQLYVTSGSASYTGVSAVGSGLPIASGTTSALLPGVSTTQPYGFALFDLSPTVAGVDTLYLADESAGVQKWTSDGTTWTKVATYNQYMNGTATATSGYRGLAGRVIGGKVYLVATAGGFAVLYTDDGSGTVAPAKLVMSAAANTGLRSAVLAPR